MRDEMARLEYLYGGVKMLNKKPACLIALDTKKSAIAIREAYKMGIPVIAIVDTNASPEFVNHVIPANDDAISSLEFIAGKLAEAVRLGNGGVGIEHKEIDFNEVDTNIQNMSKMLEEKKRTQKYGVEPNGNKPRVVRVSREQMNKSRLSK
jgi:small subunit ribosomal protein S2